MNSPGPDSNVDTTGPQEQSGGEDNLGDKTPRSSTHSKDVDMDVDDESWANRLRARNTDGNSLKRKEPPITTSASPRKNRKRAQVEPQSTQISQAGSIDKPIDVDELFVSNPTQFQ